LLALIRISRGSRTICVRGGAGVLLVQIVTVG
jgi:hypothetical protein